MRLLVAVTLLAALLSANETSAQVVNGDFSLGAAGWTTAGDLEVYRIVFPQPGVDGHVSVEQLKPAGAQSVACIEQTIHCNDPASDLGCAITVDYKVPNVPPESSIIVSIRVDGNELVGAVHPFLTEGKRLSGTVTKGTHQVQICFHGEGAGAAAQFDTVDLSTLLPSLPLSWSAIKARHASGPLAER
jgi:hypothetical protein